MHLFLVSLDSGSKTPNGDYMSAVVVAAIGYHAARKLAASVHGDEGVAVWLGSDFSTVKVIGTPVDGTKAGIVLREYNAA